MTGCFSRYCHRSLISVLRWILGLPPPECPVWSYSLGFCNGHIIVTILLTTVNNLKPRLKMTYSSSTDIWKMYVLFEQLCPISVWYAIFFLENISWAGFQSKISGLWLSKDPHPFCLKMGELGQRVHELKHARALQKFCCTKKIFLLRNTTLFIKQEVTFLPVFKLKKNQMISCTKMFKILYLKYPPRSWPKSSGLAIRTHWKSAFTSLEGQISQSQR